MIGRKEKKRCKRHKEGGEKVVLGKGNGKK